MNLLSVEGLVKPFRIKQYSKIFPGINRTKDRFNCKKRFRKDTLLKVIAGEITPDQGKSINAKSCGFLLARTQLKPTTYREECILQSENEILQVIQRYEMALLHPEKKRNTGCL